jgi:hypothetical protein
MNQNLQQPFYQAIGYGPSLLASGIPYGSWPDSFSSGIAHAPRIVSTSQMVGGEISEGVREQITQTLRELWFSLKGRAKVYQKPYPEYFDSVPYPRGFRIPDFIKFTGDDARTTYEHIG